MNILQLIFSFLVPTALGKIPDWLIKKIDYPAEILENTEDSTLTLTNGLVSRTFLYSPGFATIDLYSHEKNSSVLRAIDVEVFFFSGSWTKIISRITILYNQNLSFLLFAYSIQRKGTIKLDNITYDIGGIHTTISRAYLNRSALNDDIHPSKSASFEYIGYETKDPVAPYPYKPKRGAPANIEWPPKGLHVYFMFKAPTFSPPSHQDVIVIVHYEIYIGT